MNDSLPEALREAARGALPSGAFLRRDRGDALFITDAPRHRPQKDWEQILSNVGFDCELNQGMLRLYPSAAWLESLSARFSVPPDAFCASALRFASRPTETDSLRLFALGVRILDGESGAEAYDRLLRRRMAVCLRSGGGGGLYACALIKYLIERK